MKKTTLCIFLSLAAINCNAGDPEFIKFVLDKAHAKNFMGCDSAIKSAFADAGGADIRVNTEFFDETKNDSIKLTSTYGSKGDSIFLEAEFRKSAGKCFMTKTSMMTTSKSCTAYASEMKAFEFVAETVDYVWMKNKGGIPMLLTPLNGGCVAIFQQGTYF